MFVHLRLHTEFSIVDGTNRIDETVKAAAADRQPALAITDLNNLFGAIKFYKEARSAGVKPIIGTEILLQGLSKDPGVLSRIVLLVQNKQGYLNLCELLARGWTGNVVKAQGACKLEWLRERGEGLIALAGAQAGPVGQALLQGDEGRATEAALALASIFPHRFYIEVQRAGRVDDEAHVAAAVQLAARLNLPVVATHPVQFTRQDDYEAHEARVCISEGEILGNQRRVRKFTREQYFKPQEAMEQLFADLPSAVANTLEIAKRCNLVLELGKPRLPDYPTPNGMPIEEYFRFASHEGLKERMLHLYPNAAQRDKEMPRYVQRLEFEINTILKMGFPGYFLIVGDFINWAKKNGCPVGPGRGSGAGSLVAYSLKITDLDPLQYNLLFERFLNPERVSMPDFDIDFCQSNRDRVIDYVKDKYGKEAVSQIATFGTMAARAAIRDVGRVLDMSYTFCDGISKLIPNKPGQHITIAGALEVEPVLAERLAKEDEVKTLLGLAQKLEGLTRNVGMHAGGVLIAPGKLTDFTPLYQQPGSDSAVSQYDKDDVEAAGLVKFDFLGLATLTILEIAKDFIRERHPGQENFAFENIPLDDAHTYRLFTDGKTEAVFQFESRGMQGMLRDARPSRLGRPDRAERAVPPGPDGPDPDLRGAQERPRAGGVSAPAGGRNAVRDLRHHGLPGAGDADGADPGRLLARRRRPAAPGHGQEEGRGDGRAPADLPCRRGEEQHQRGEGGRNLRLDGEVRGLRLQQVARRRLLAAGLPHRLAEGSLHGRVLLRQHDRGNGRHGQAQGLVRRRPEEFRPDLRAPGRQPRRVPLRADFRQGHPLRAGCREGHGPPGDRCHREGPRRGRRLSPASTTSACGSIARASTSARWRR